MSYSPDLLELGHTPGTPADTAHRAGHRINQNLEAIADALTAANHVFREFTIDAGEGSFATGDHNLWYRLPFNCRLASWRSMVRPQGSIEIDLRVITDFADFPAASEASITGGNNIEVNNGIEAYDNTLEGWQLDRFAGDIICLEVISATNLDRITLTLEFTR